MVVTCDNIPFPDFRQSNQSPLWSKVSCDPWTLQSSSGDCWSKDLRFPMDFMQGKHIAKLRHAPTTSKALTSGEISLKHVVVNRDEGVKNSTSESQSYSLRMDTVSFIFESDQRDRKIMCLFTVLRVRSSHSSPASTLAKAALFRWKALKAHCELSSLYDSFPIFWSSTLLPFLFLVPLYSTHVFTLYPPRLKKHLVLLTDKPAALSRAVLQKQNSCVRLRFRGILKVQSFQGWRWSTIVHYCITYE